MAKAKIEVTTGTLGNLYRKCKARILEEKTDGLDKSYFFMRECLYAILDWLDEEGVEISINDKTKRGNK